MGRKNKKARVNDSFSNMILQVNGDGQLFCLDEWASIVAGKGKNTFVLLCNDYQ